MRSLFYKSNLFMIAGAVLAPLLACADPVSLPSDQEFWSCPANVKAIRATSRQQPMLTCAPQFGPTQRVTTQQSDGTLEVKEAGTMHGPLQQMYEKYYNGLPDSEKKGFIAPNDPHLALLLYHFKDQTYGDIVTFHSGLGDVTPKDFWSVTQTQFDLKGNELSRETKFQKMGHRCSRTTFATGFVAVHCDGEVGKEYKDQYMAWHRPELVEDECTDLKTNISLKRKMIFNENTVDASIYKNNHLIETRYFKTRKEAHDAIQSFGDSDAPGKKSKSDIWKVLHRCNRVHDYSGLPGMADSARNTMLDYLGLHEPAQKTAPTSVVPNSNPGQKKSATPPAEFQVR